MFIRLSTYEISILHKAINDYLERNDGADSLEAENRRILQGIVEKLYPERRQHLALAMIFDRKENAFGFVYYNGPGKKLTVEDGNGRICAELDEAEDIGDAAEVMERTIDGGRYGIHWYE